MNLKCYSRNTQKLNTTIGSMEKLYQTGLRIITSPEYGQYKRKLILICVTMEHHVIEKNAVLTMMGLRLMEKVSCSV